MNIALAHHKAIMRQGIAIQMARSSQRSKIVKLAGGDGETLEYHFKPVKRTASTLELHAGRVQFNGTVLLLATDGGTSGSYVDVNTVTVTEAGYLCLDLDSPTAPTTLIPSIHPAYPDAMSDKSWAIAYVPFADSAIGKIEPIWTGGDFVWPIQQFRYVEATGKLQMSFLVYPNPAEDSADWITIYTTEECASELTQRVIEVKDHETGQIVILKGQFLNA